MCPTGLHADDPILLLLGFVFEGEFLRIMPQA
jgi:hypothetical protein